MAVELAVGYISLVTDASRIPGEVDRALGRAGRNADQQGQSIGRRMAAGIGTTLKAGALAAGAAAGAAIGTALAKGFGRLTAIDDAQGKLRGLGHDAATIQKIMDSALASVKGTAFGLGDAATVAATAVAAGIEPGQQLTKYLKLIADASTIAGTSLGEMGSIINQTTTGGIVFTDTLNQLADRGIPIFTWLQEETKKTGKDFRKMVEDGGLDAKTFQKVLAERVGGAAKESGNTVRGALANVGAAFGRLGAAALAPTFGRLTSWFKDLSGVIDQVTARFKPLIERMDAVLFRKIGPQLGQMWRELGSSDAARFASNSLGDVGNIFGDLGKSAQDATPAILSIGKALAGAGGTVAAGAWTAFTKAMDAAAQITGGVLVPALQGVAGIISSNQGAVTALIAGWLAWRLIPPRLQAVGTAMTALQARATTGASAIRGVATAAGGVAQVAGVGATALGRFGSAVQQLGTHAPVVARMQQSFLDSAAAAQRFGRSAGAASVAAQGIRSAATGLSGALGGPWGMAIAAATVAVIGIASEVRKASQQQDIMRESTTGLAIAQRQMAKQFQESNGDVSSTVLTSLSEQFEKVISDSEALARTAPGAFSVFTGGWKDITGWFQGHAQAGTDAVHAQERLAEQGAATRDSFRELGLSAQEMAQKVAGSDGDFNVFVGRLLATANGGEQAVKAVRQIREAFLRARQAALDTTPGFFTLTDAIKTLSDTSATASDRLSAMKSALDVLSGRKLSAQDALAKYNEQVRETVRVTQEWNAALGSGQQLLGQGGQVNTATENGKRLYDTLLGIRDATLSVAQSGGDLNAAFAQNDQQFEQLAKAVGLTKAQIIEMAAQLGYLPTDIKIFANLEGAGDVTQQLTAIAALLTRNREGVTIPTKALTDEAKAALEALGVTIETVTGKPDEVRIVAKTDEALAKLQELAALKLPDKTQKVKLDFDTSGYSLPIETRQKLHEDISGITPRADGGIDNLPGSATIWSPQTRLYQVSEPETGGEAFIPLAPSKRARSMDILAQVADMFGVSLFKFADGGLLPRGVASALQGARSATGTTYKWGGTTTAGFDCSGFVGWIQQLLQGIANPTARLYTTLSLLGGATAGLKRGWGPAGTYFQVGVNSEHMAATLNGQPVESGGAHGTSRLGAPAVGAQDRQFTARFYLPNELIDGIKDKGVSTGTGSQKKKSKEWTERDQIDLDQLALEVEDAKRDRDAVYGDSNKDDIDRRKADLRVREAEQKLLDKQNEKDGVGSSTDNGITPDAPGLESRLDDDQISWERATLARDEAEENRNEVYANPESSDNDKRRADLELQAAENAIDDLRDEQSKEKSASTTKTQTQTITDRIKQFGADVVGIVVDAFKEQLPFGLGQSRWWDIPITTTETSTSTEDTSTSKTAPTAPTSFPQEQVEQQFPVTLGDDAVAALKPYISIAPPGIQEWLKQAGVGVFDQGGWLKPGALALNLSNRPEPIFNSPAQMRDFMGGVDLAAPAPAGPDFSVHINNPQFSDGQAAVRQATRVQERQQMRYAGRP